MPWVFGYGSLVDRGSLEATLGRAVAAEDGPVPARLRDHRRAWNVAGHSDLRPDYDFTGPDGEHWRGAIVFLGIEADPGGSVLGAAYRLDEADLALLDSRELGYDRVDVTDLLDRPVGRPGEEIWTYWPKAEAVARARSIGAAGTVVTRYLRLLERGYSALGEVLHAEHVATLPDPAPFRVAEITAVPRDAAAPNLAVDPRPPSADGGGSSQS